MASSWNQTPGPLRGLFWAVVGLGVVVALVIALVLWFALTPHAGL